MLKSLTIFAITFLALLICSQHPLNAKDFGLNYEKINPDSIIYPIKRLTENVWLKVKGSGARSELLAYYTDRRLREMVYMFDKGKTGFFVEVVSRYNSFVGLSKSEFGDQSILKKTRRTTLEY